MRRLKNLGLLGVCFIALMVAFSGRTVSALETLVTEKEVPLTIIVVTPTPVAFAPPQPARSVSSPIEVADISSYDVPMGIQQPVVIAQSASQQGAVPVKFQTKPDPTATYLHEVPNNTTLTATQGTTTYFTCPFEIYAYYTTAYNVTDWGYGTSTTASAGTFPILNYPTNSDMAWSLSAVGATPAPGAKYTLYADSGAPGQTSFSGTAGEKQTQCLNVSVTVPASQPAGTYTAVIQYNLYST